MSLQQAGQPRSAANGFGRRRIEKDGGPRLDSKLQTVKANPSRLSSVGKEGGCASPSRERLVYLTTCLIGHQVEVHVVDGSAFSGIFHATNAEKDFGIVLKMARLVRDGSRGQKGMTDSVNKPPLKTLIIPAKELVQVIAKGVPVTRDGLGNELQREKHQEILIDSFISQSRRAEMERELERWVPEDDDPVCPELENIFDGHWDRGWDQFQANETLFGVKSTFNEELYTTKLEKGPQMKELEREALRIAREIEGEDTHDLHLAEERGLQLHEKLEVDEETRFSSVFRGVDDCGYDDIEDILLDTHNNETFGGGYVSGIGKSFADLTSVNSSNGAQLSTRSSPLEEAHTAQLSTSREVHQSGSDDHLRQLSAGHLSKGSLNAGDNRAYENQFTDHDTGNEMVSEEAQTSKPEDSQSSQRSKLESNDKGGLSANATAYAPSRASSKNQEKTSSNELSDVIGSSKAPGTVQSVSSRVRPSSSASSTSDCGGGASASGGPGLSPSSSMGSLSSEKSTLNPHAKEFKLNPHAKSFVPSQTPLRPPSPVSDGSFYYPANMAAIPNMHGMPVGIGIGPTFTAHQPVIFNPQAAPTPQSYFHPSGPQYGRQMMISHPQQVLYMPTTYNPEMPYKGREY